MTAVAAVRFLRDTATCLAGDVSGGIGVRPEADALSWLGDPFGELVLSAVRPSIGVRSTPDPLAAA